MLLSLVENLFESSDSPQATIIEGEEEEETPAARKVRLIRRMKMQVSQILQFSSISWLQFSRILLMAWNR